MLSNIRAVAFDLDNTLWDIEPVISRAERRLLDWMREHCPLIPERYTPEEMKAARMQLASDEPHKAHDFGYLRRTMMARHALACGYEESIGTRAFEVFYTARNEIDLFSDVRPALERLQTRYVLGTLSNGNANLVLVGISHYFNVMLNAGDIGCAKPDPRTFARLVEFLGVEPGEVLYVGDDAVFDVEGACAAGLRTAWMNRADSPWPDGIRRADLEVRDCTQLADHLLNNH